MEAVEARVNEKGINLHDWFFATRPLSKEEVEKKIYEKK
jgi:hypothetical protein